MFQNAVELTSVKPGTPTLRAVVNFDAYPLGHLERGAVNRTFHCLLLLLAPATNLRR